MVLGNKNWLHTMIPRINKTRAQHQVPRPIELQANDNFKTTIDKKVSVRNQPNSWKISLNKIGLSSKDIQLYLGLSENNRHLT